MKKFRKLMALVVAMVMVLSMSMTVFAAPEDKKLTVPNETGHTYEVFRDIPAAKEMMRRGFLWAVR